MKRYLLSNYAIQIMNSINDSLSWTELSYYRSKLIAEKNRLLSFESIIPVSEQLELNETLNRVQSSINKVTELMNSCNKVEKNFSYLTNRLKNLHR